MIRLALPPRPQEHVALAVSPLLECVLSLHVLLGPGHHALQQRWVRRMRSIDPSLRREIERFGFVYRHQIADLFGAGLGQRQGSFADELAHIRSLGAELLLAGLGRPLYDHGGARGAEVFDDPEVRRTALERAGGAGSRSRSAAAALLDDPVDFAGRLCGMLERYWLAVFADEWAQIEGRLQQSLGAAARLLPLVGVWPVLGRLPPHCRVDPFRRELRVDLPHDHLLQIASARPLVLSPSCFVWPHLRVNCDLPWPASIVYAAPSVAREAEPSVPPAELLSVLRALADDSRLRILRRIAEAPRSSQELEPLVGLSRAGLSKGLRRLAGAGLISPRREGYYVVYSLAPERLGALSVALDRYLDPD